MAGAAVDLQLEGDLPSAQLLDHAVDRGEWIAFVFGAVKDQVHTFGVLRPSCLVVAERAVDRDICNERCTGCPELNADRAAKAVADERDIGRVNHWVLDERIEPRLGPRTHQRAVLGVDCGLRLHFRDVLRQHALPVAEYICCKRDVTELGPDLGEPQSLGSHAFARMDHQHGRPPAGHFVVVDHIGFELGVAVRVLDPLALHLGLCWVLSERKDGD